MEGSESLRCFSPFAITRSPDTMATIDSLANETLIHIIEYLRGPPLPDWDNSTDQQEGRYNALRAAALVCSRWRDPAQRALFDELHLPDPDDSRDSLFCDSSARPRYRTRSLCANGWGRQQAWLTAAAEACTGLESLSVLEDVGDEDTDQSNWGEFAHPAFHGLKHLNLMYPENFKDPEDTSTTLPFRLTSLCLWLDIAEGTSLHFLQALTSAILISLETLRLRVALPDALARFRPSFLLLGPHLRTLVLGASHEAFKDHYHDTITSLTSLRRLEIDLGWLYRHKLSAGFEFLSKILDHLPDPPSLKHLVIKSTEPPSGGPILVIEHKCLSKIEELVWCAARDPSSQKQGTIDEWESSDGVEATRRVCEERGIRFGLVDDRS